MTAETASKKLDEKTKSEDELKNEEGECMLLINCRVQQLRLNLRSTAFR